MRYLTRFVAGFRFLLALGWATSGVSLVGEAVRDNQSLPVAADPIVGSSSKPTEAERARVRLRELRAEIARHDVLYFQKAAPEISDAAYDKLKQELRALEKALPELATIAATEGIGDDRTGLFQTRRHRVPMLSLEKAYAENDLRGFQARIEKAFAGESLTYVVEPKIDGLAISVTYENGQLIQAVTRGNGTEGDDITDNVRRISGLPQKLPDTAPRLVELRGEIFVSFAEFSRINRERETAGEVLFSSPRNLAAGTVRQIDPEIVASRRLQIVFYGFGAWEPVSALPGTQRDLQAQLRVWGVPTLEPAHVQTVNKAEELWNAVQTMGRTRRELPFPTDGVVVKLDAIAQQREVGTSETSPRWAVAFKFAPERVETRLLAITLQVGRTGVLTPVAELEPVELAGSTIARATLHNRAEITRKDLRVGDFVWVEKAGEIIPIVVGVNVARRPIASQPFAFPEICPVCTTTLMVSASEASVRCPNASCLGQLRRRLEHFASDAGVDIAGLGPATIEVLVGSGAVKSVADIYRLTRDQLLAVDGIGEKSADTLLAAIARSRRAELWRFVHGLGLSGVGEMTAKKLARRWGSLDGLAANEPERLSAEVVAELREVGVDPTVPASAARRLNGKVFVLTGTLSGLARAEAIKRIEEAGGSVSSSLSKKTNYLVAGANSGAKLTQARQLGVTVIDEAAFLTLLAEMSP